MGRPRRHLERRRLHVAELHLQSRAERDGAAKVADRRCPAVLLVCLDARAGLARHGQCRFAVYRGSANLVTVPPEQTVYYRRSRFTTHLPRDRRYTAAHYWLLEEFPGSWRVGFTRFATRMLGDIVEFEFSVPSGAGIATGAEIGSIEGLKAVTTIFSSGTGQFGGENQALRGD